MQKIVVITSMHAKGWEDYGARFVSTFSQMWPKEVTLEIYAEGFNADVNDARVHILDFEQACGGKSRKFDALYQQVMAKASLNVGHNYRLYADKFAKKGLVITAALAKHAGQKVIWLDSDIYSFAPVQQQFLDELVQAKHPEVFCTYLRRFGMHTESGFLAFNTSHFLTRDFIERYESLYLSGAVFHLEGWTDCHVLDWVRALHVADGHGGAYYELPSIGNRHVFVNSPLGLLMDHLKGSRKEEAHSRHEDFIIPPRSRVKFDGRYAQLNTLIELFQPKSFIEVGTWSGWRAVQMAMMASRYTRSMSYRGYDVFEGGTAELDAREKNVKPHFPEQSVRQLLDFCRFLVPGFSFDLVAGDTQQTLLRGDKADFAFVDGGHALQTIESDFEALTGTPVIVLDDYYEGSIDTNQFGCNRIIDGLPHRILPIADPVARGGLVRFAVVAEESALALIDERLSTNHPA